MSSLPKGLTESAQLWSAFVAKEVKTKPANNANSWFLVGRTLVDTETFNKLNDKDHDLVHGVMVVYGPFDSKEAAREFVADYPPDLYPGDLDWHYAQPGTPFILSNYYEPSYADIVHNKSLEFQGQIAYNDMQRKIKEMEEVQKRLKDREPTKMTPEEKVLRVKWQKDQIQQAEKNLEGMKKFLSLLEKQCDKEDVESSNKDS